MDLPHIDFMSWMPKVWESARWFLTINQPWIMIAAAFGIIYGIASIIIWLMGGAKEEDDDGYDYEEY